MRCFDILRPYFFILKIYEGRSKIKIVSGLLIAISKPLVSDLTVKVYFFNFFKLSVRLIISTSNKFSLFFKNVAFLDIIFF